MKKQIQTLEYRGIICDSYEEVYALYWLFELQDRGLIESINRSPSFELSRKVTQDYTEVIKLKTKTKIVSKSKTILREHIYTPEFEVVWKKDLGIMFCKNNVSYIEIKPLYDQNNMTRLFKINQKWMFAKHNILVNLLVPEKLFQETFTPKEYLKTATGKRRKIKWKIKTFEEWINTVIT
jgi:hypothetical protein